MAVCLTIRRITLFSALLLCAAIGRVQEPLTIEKATGFSTTIYPRVLTLTPDGKTWFADERFTPHSIGYFTAAGAVTSFPIPCGECAQHTKISYIESITAGPDGNVWFIWTHVGSDGSPINGGMNSYVGRVTPDGTFTSFGVPTVDAFRRYVFGASGISTITAGPDGNLWFTESPANKVGRITPTGDITEWSLPAFSAPSVIVTGSDGNLWFTQPGAGKIGRITPAGTLTHFTVGPFSGAGAASPWGLATGADNNLWFTDRDGKVGRITTAGVITRYTVLDGNLRSQMVRGPDNNFYTFAAKAGNPAPLFVVQFKPNLLPSAAGITPQDDSPAIDLTQFSLGAGLFQFLSLPPAGLYATGFVPEPALGGNYVDALFKITIKGLEPGPCDNFAIASVPSDGKLATTVGADILLTTQASGGKAPYVYETEGLPGGLEAGDDNSTIHGEIVRTKTLALVITATDSNVPPCTAEAAFYITVTPAAPPASGIPPPKATSKANRPHGGSSGDPVSTSTGELFFDESPDLVIPGPMTLSFVRSYASNLTTDANLLSSLGTNWVHNFDLAIRTNGDVAHLVLHRGRVVEFRRSGGVWARTSRSTVAYQLLSTADGFAVADPLLISRDVEA